MNYVFIGKKYGFKLIKNKANNRIGFFIDNIPVIGIEHFGIVDYGTNVIVVRPNTGCLLDCIYCYVNESSKIKKDFLIDKSLLVKYFKKLMRIKTHEVEAHLDSEGDIFLYPWIFELIKELTSISRVTIDTHGYLLNNEVMDKLVELGVERLNIVVNTLKQEKARMIYGRDFNIKELLGLIRDYSRKINISLTPILIPGYNYDELKDIVRWAQKNMPKGKYPRVIPQNYMVYAHGKKPVRPMPFPGFIQFLKNMEEELNEELWIDFRKIGIYRDNSLKLFSKNEVVEAKIILPGRWPRERIALARDSLIVVKNTNARIGSIKKVRITHAFHTYEGVIQ